MLSAPPSYSPLAGEREASWPTTAPRSHPGRRSLSRLAADVLYTIRVHSRRTYYVYIMTDPSHTALYVGITNNLKRRVYEHKHKLVEGFTSKYNAIYLVYYEETNDVREAIAREKQIKGWLRVRKVALIEANNPNWRDLSVDLLDD